MKLLQRLQYSKKCVSHTEKRGLDTTGYGVLNYTGKVQSPTGCTASSVDGTKDGNTIRLLARSHNRAFGNI